MNSMPMINLPMGLPLRHEHIRVSCPAFSPISIDEKMAKMEKESWELCGVAHLADRAEIWLFFRRWTTLEVDNG